MKMLPLSNFEKACYFVKTQARPLDRALLAYYFEGTSNTQVLQALQAYQNPDGGFGNSLEPDFRLPDSAPMATTIGFQYLQAVAADKKHEMVQKGCQYFQETYDEALKGWQPVPPSVNEVPRAFWWNHNPDLTVQERETGWANPSAEILGYLYAYGADSQWCQELTDKALEHLAGMESIEAHDLLCYLRLANHLPPEPQALVLEKLVSTLPQTVALSPELWVGYALRPWWVVDSHTSLLYPHLTEAIASNLDFELENQQPDGGWYPFWSWGRFEEIWKTTKMEWAGYLTVKLLKILDNFKRIER